MASRDALLHGRLGGRRRTATALMLLGLSAAFGGPWVERRGPRVAATAAAEMPVSTFTSGIPEPLTWQSRFSAVQFNGNRYGKGCP